MQSSEKLATNKSSIENVYRQVESVDILIYAPPAYGKTTYQTNCRKQCEYSIHDTDSLDCPPGSHLEILLTNYYQLLSSLNYQLAIVFLPDEWIFKSMCEYRGLNYKESWYNDVQDAVQQASNSNNIIIITSGSPLLRYDPFIRKCLDAIYDGEPLPNIPTINVPYEHQPKTTNIVVLNDDPYSEVVTKIKQPIEPGSQELYISKEIFEQDAETIDDATLLSETIPTDTQDEKSDTSSESFTTTSFQEHASSFDHCKSNINLLINNTSTIDKSLKPSQLTNIFICLKELNEPMISWSPKYKYQMHVRNNYTIHKYGSVVTICNSVSRFHISNFLHEALILVQPALGNTMV